MTCLSRDHTVPDLGIGGVADVADCHRDASDDSQNSDKHRHFLGIDLLRDQVPSDGDDEGDADETDEDHLDRLSFV